MDNKNKDFKLELYSEDTSETEKKTSLDNEGRESLDSIHLGKDDTSATEQDAFLQNSPEGATQNVQRAASSATPELDPISSIQNISLENFPKEERSNTKANKKTSPFTKKITPSSSAQSDDTLITVTLLQELVSLLRPRPFRKRHPIIFWGSIILVIGFLWLVFTGEGSSLGGDRIAVVRIEGAIMETTPTLEWIRKLEKADHVKGVLLRIDSPGGGAAASQEIHGALLNLAKKKPIVASMGSAAASGGLMVAMAAEYIVANPSTITGSIGVRMDIPQIYKLMESLGVGQESLTSGKFKDAASMMRALNPEERAYLQSIIDDLHGQFVAMVAEGRKKTLGEVQKIADGRIFTGREALHLGIVDALGGQDVALADLYERTGVNPDADLYEDTNLKKEYNSFLKSLLPFDVSSDQGDAVFLYR